MDSAIVYYHFHFVPVNVPAMVQELEKAFKRIDEVEYEVMFNRETVRVKDA